MMGVGVLELSPVNTDALELKIELIFRGPVR